MISIAKIFVLSGISTKHAWKIGMKNWKSRRIFFPSILFFIDMRARILRGKVQGGRGEGRKGATTRRLNYVPDANTGVLSGAAGVLHPSFSFLENSAHEIRGFASVHTLNTTRASEFDALVFPLLSFSRLVLTLS